MVEVSIIIPTYNRAEVLKRAIDSALAQTVSEIEVIVIDDGSTDQTDTVLESYEDPRITYIQHSENRGGSAARNSGIKRAAGQYIAFLDSDDEWHPEKLERQVGALENRSDEWGAIYCAFNQQRQNSIATIIDQFFERKTGLQGGEDLVEDILLLEFAHGGSSTLLVRSELVKELNGFDETFQRHQDWEFLIRLLQRTKLAFIDDDLITKYDTGYPGVKTATKARGKYLKKFADLVVDHSLSGKPVIERHRFALAKIGFSNGEFRQGIRHLRHSSSPTFRDYLGLLLAFYNGIIRNQ